MVAEVVTGLSAIKTAFDLAKGLKDMTDAAMRNAAVIELQERILTAQQAQAELIEHVRELEQKVADFEKWEAEKQNYELCKIASDTFAYAKKETVRGAEPAHYICANCYEHRKRAIMQRADNTHLFCPECKTRVRYDSAEATAFRRGLVYRPGAP